MSSLGKPTFKKKKIVPKHAKSYWVDFGTLRDYTYYVVIKLNITFINVGEVGTVTVYTMLMLLIGNIFTIIKYYLLDR